MHQMGSFVSRSRWPKVYGLVSWRSWVLPESVKPILGSLGDFLPLSSAQHARAPGLQPQLKVGVFVNVQV